MSDVDDGQRTLTLTNGGQQRYTELYQRHLTVEDDTFKKVCSELEQIDANLDNLATLEEIQRRILRLATKLKTGARECLGFLSRTGTVTSQQDEQAFATLANRHKAVLEDGLVRLQELISDLQPNPTPSQLRYKSSVNSTLPEKCWS